MSLLACRHAAALRKLLCVNKTFAVTCGVVLAAVVSKLSESVGLTSVRVVRVFQAAVGAMCTDKVERCDGVQGQRTPLTSSRDMQLHLSVVY